MRERMKSPFRKLRDLALNKQGLKQETSPTVRADAIPDVAKCMQDAEDMRVKYEGLLTNGQIISGAAYDFSRALQDMALYMMEVFGEFVEEEIGNIFSTLAKVQFDMSKLLDLFAAHVSKVIIKPTEMMMSKIQQAEVIREQYEEKRKLYALSQIEKQKGKGKRGKGNQANQQQSVSAKDGVVEQAHVLNFYMQALRQGQSRGLVTQAVMYHSAQVHLFSKGLASINTMEPMMKQLALDNEVDRTLSEEDLPVNDYLKGRELAEEDELPRKEGEADSTGSSPPGHLLEPLRYSSEFSEEFVPKSADVNSKSAPISPLIHHRKEGGRTVPEILREGEPGAPMYALPSPSALGSERWDVKMIGDAIDQKFPESHCETAYYSGSILDAQKPSRPAQPSNNGHGVHLQQYEEQHFQMRRKHEEREDLNGFFVEKGKRYTQSGPIIDNQSVHARPGDAKNLNHQAAHKEYLSPLYRSGPIHRSPVSSHTTGKIQSMPPPPLSLPLISELHKLPLPPPGLTTTPKSPIRTSSPTASKDITYSYV